MRNDVGVSYLKTLFAVLLSVGLILFAIWWYWSRNSDVIVARVLRASRDPQVLDELGQTLGERGAEGLLNMFNKKK